MIKFVSIILAFIMIQSISIAFCFSKIAVDSHKNLDNFSSLTDEIVFYSNGSTFSPVIVLQANASILWTWDDNTTSNSLAPTKDYGSSKLRLNRLKVTPWSALRRINIGYDASDGGSGNIELVPDQHASRVENLSLVAPYLKEWCSSYNNIDSLNFSNFVNLETIECFKSRFLRKVNLTNTTKLKRICFEENNLINFDISDSPALEDIRAAINKYKTIDFSNYTQDIWHICVRDNPQITNTNLFNDLSKFPKLAELFIWDTNQQGNLVIPSTHPNKEVFIKAYQNKYSSLNLKGALRNNIFYGCVEMSHNNLTKVDISGCIQIKKLDLSYNDLDSLMVDQVLKQADEFGSSNGTIDLRFNAPPTSIGLGYMKNLKNRGWIVNIDQVYTGWNQNLNDPYLFKVYANSSNGKIIIHLDTIPPEGIMVEIRDILGKKLINQKIFNNINELPIYRSNANFYFITLRDGNWTKTKKVVL